MALLAEREFSGTSSFQTKTERPLGPISPFRTEDMIGCTARALNERVKKAEVDSGDRSCVPAGVADRLKALEPENREHRQANEILRKPSAYFAHAGLASSRERERDTALISPQIQIARHEI